MSISERITSFPEFAKDIKLNYSKILNETTFNKIQLYSLILISSLSTNSKELIKLAVEEVKDSLDDVTIEAVNGAYSIMSMNAIYYRFTHLATDFDYSSIPANLRMQFLTKHNISNSDFEMLCLAVAIQIGCEKCINAHIAVLKKNNINTQTIQSIARVVSIINAISNTMRIA